MEFDTRFTEELPLKPNVVVYGLFDADLPNRDTGK